MTLMIMGIGLLPIALYIENSIMQAILLIASCVLNLVAIVKSIKEKKHNQ